MIETLRRIYKIEGKISHGECYFLYKLAKKVLAEFSEEPVLCEIGSYQGKSTVSIAMALKESGRGILYAVDWHQGSPGFLGYGQGQYQSSFDRYLNNLRAFSVDGRVVTIKDKSDKSFDKVPERIHLLWIDGSHDYADVKSDYDNYHKKLVKGGYVLFHDACWTTWKDPFRVISECILNDENYNLYALMGNTVVFKKEKNGTCRIARLVLQHLCIFVSGTNRAFYKRLMSAFFLRLSSLHALYKLRCPKGRKGVFDNKKSY